MRIWKKRTWRERESERGSEEGGGVVCVGGLMNKQSTPAAHSYAAINPCSHPRYKGRWLPSAYLLWVANKVAVLSRLMLAPAASIALCAAYNNPNVPRRVSFLRVILFWWFRCGRLQICKYIIPPEYIQITVTYQLLLRQLLPDLAQQSSCNS